MHFLLHHFFFFCLKNPLKDTNFFSSFLDFICIFPATNIFENKKIIVKRVLGVSTLLFLAPHAAFLLYN